MDGMSEIVIRMVIDATEKEFKALVEHGLWIRNLRLSLGACLALLLILVFAMGGLYC